MRNIVKIDIFRMDESCQRSTFYVRVTTDEGMTKEVEGHRTGSLYTNFEGLSVDEARDRALIDAHTWADFLELTVEPYMENDVEFHPSMKFESYTMRREIRDRA